jgi:hypothetical protein
MGRCPRAIFIKDFKRGEVDAISTVLATVQDSCPLEYGTGSSVNSTPWYKQYQHAWTAFDPYEQSARLQQILPARSAGPG